MVLICRTWNQPRNSSHWQIIIQPRSEQYISLYFCVLFWWRDTHENIKYLNIILLYLAAEYR